MRLFLVLQTAAICFQFTAIVAFPHNQEQVKKENDEMLVNEVIEKQQKNTHLRRAVQLNQEQDNEQNEQISEDEVIENKQRTTHLRHLKGRNSTEAWNNPHDGGGFTANEADTSSSQWSSPHDEDNLVLARLTGTSRCFWSEAAKEVASWINSVRKERGLEPLERSCHLRHQALSCSVQNGNNKSSEHCCTDCLENIAHLYKTSRKDARTSLTSSTGHLDTMLHPGIRYLGVGVYHDDGHWYITQRFS